MLTAILALAMISQVPAPASKTTTAPAAKATKTPSSTPATTSTPAPSAGLKEPSAEMKANMAKESLRRHAEARAKNARYQALRKMQSKRTRTRR